MLSNSFNPKKRRHACVMRGLCGGCAVRARCVRKLCESRDPETDYHINSKCTLGHMKYITENSYAPLDDIYHKLDALCESLIVLAATVFDDCSVFGRRYMLVGVSFECWNNTQQRLCKVNDHKIRSMSRAQHKMKHTKRAKNLICVH